MKKLFLSLVGIALVTVGVLTAPSVTLNTNTGAQSQLPPPGGPIITDTVVDITAVKAAQDLYFSQTGKYLPVLEGGVLPIEEKGDVQSKLGISLPSNVRIETYKTPLGQSGYQICTETSTSTSCVNVGGSAREAWRTYVQPRPDRATSTLNLAPLGSLFSFAYPLAYAITTNTHSASTTRASSQYLSIADASQVGLDGGASMTFCTRFRLGTYNAAADNHTLMGKGLSGDASRQFRWSILCCRHKHLNI